MTPETGETIVTSRTIGMVRAAGMIKKVKNASYAYIDTKQKKGEIS